jgi:hypothetical protein
MTEKIEENVVPKGTVKSEPLFKKRKKWNEDKLRFSITEYFVPRINTLSMAEQQRFDALAIKSHPLLPEEYVVVRT